MQIYSSTAVPVCNLFTKERIVQNLHTEHKTFSLQMPGNFKNVSVRLEENLVTYEYYKRTCKLSAYSECHFDYNFSQLFCHLTSTVRYRKFTHTSNGRVEYRDVIPSK